jgi:Yip1-like protein
MNLVERAKNILLQPKSEWEVISGESATVPDLYKAYIVPLAAIGPAASIIGFSLMGVSVPLMGTVRMSILGALGYAITSYVLALVGVFLVALIIDTLAPSFGGEKNQIQALKVAAYASTPSWVAGILMLLPMLSVIALLAALYGLYLLYLGLPLLMKAPQDKAIAYTVVVVVAAVVVMAVLGSVSHVFLPTPTMPMHGMGGIQ